MRTDNNGIPLFQPIKLIYRDYSAAPQLLDNAPVMYQLSIGIDYRRSVLLSKLGDGFTRHIDRPAHPKAKACVLCKKNFH